MKRVKIFTLILPCLFAILFQSCASFDKEFVNPNPLKTQNLHNLEGTYDIANIVFDSIKNEKVSYFNTHANFFKEIDRHKYELIECCSFDLALKPCLCHILLLLLQVKNGLQIS